MPALGAALCLPTTAVAGIKYKDGDKFFKVGGRIQLQYHMEDPDNGDSTDELFLRRFRTYIQGSVHPDWVGKFQVDFGKANGDNEAAVKDAFLQYSGHDNVLISVGSKHFPFSREQLTSSKKQQLVERSFVGDHNYGTPDRQLGVYVDSRNSDTSFKWSLGIAQAGLDPDNQKLDFDSLAVKNADFNEGWMVGGRLDWGNVAFSQTNFKEESQLGFGVAAFSWSNDDDNNVLGDSAGDKTPVDSVVGVELSLAYRVAGLSLDAQYNSFSAELIGIPSVLALTAGSTDVDFGIYDANGETALDNFAIKAGYLTDANNEFVAGLQFQDADGYVDQWDRFSIGYNRYFTAGSHDIKVQFTYRINENVNGQSGNDVNELFIQTQFVF